MAERQVTASGKDKDGDITKLCNSGQPWSPRSKASAIEDIESGAHTYFVIWPEGKRQVTVVNGTKGKYLRSLRDGSSRNNLNDLPHC